MPRTYNTGDVIFDLHTHTTASDGALQPAGLIQLAAEHNVDCLAITDHDTLSAFETLDPTSSSGPKLLVGIEMSTVWRGHSVHIIGLNVDRHNRTLLDGLVAQQAARLGRATTIASRLTNIGIDDPLPAVLSIAGSSTIGRPHFARHLVNIGTVKDTRTAFRKYLGAGKPGDVKQCWASLPEVISWIAAAGGTPVLAHPTKYGMTWTKLRALIEEFRMVGGLCVEVVCGSQEMLVTKKLADLTNEFELTASCGSDFHQLSSWSAPGRFQPLPSSVTRVWDTW